MEQFKKLGLSQEVLQVLDDAGFEKPTEIQEKTIPLALAGNDIIGGSKTGSGKTLAFASPIIENLKVSNHVQALILTPTRELAEQVSASIKEFAKNKKINVLPIYGGVNMDTQIRRLGAADVIVGTPGRILDHLERRTLRLDSVKYLVLDEVDRMFDMGFHRDVEKIINHCPKQRQTMLFSATISSAIDSLAQKYTNNPVEVSVQSYVDHSKLKQIYYDIESNQKLSLLVHLLNNEKSGLSMVFCSTRRTVDFVQKNLCKSGVEASGTHGGVSQNQRNRILEKFHSKKVGVLVCTDVAARGLDIKGVSHVYNYDIPSESEDYTHRIGRTARAGENGKAISFLSNRDYDSFGRIIRNDSIKITNEEVPTFDRVTIKTEYDKGRNFGGNPRRGFGSNKRQGYNDNPRNSPRKHSNGRTSSNYSRGRTNSNSSGRSYSRGGSSGGSYLRGRNNSGSSGRSYSRGSNSGSSYSRGGNSGSRSNSGSSSRSYSRDSRRGKSSSNNFRRSDSKRGFRGRKINR